MSLEEVSGGVACLEPSIKTKAYIAVSAEVKHDRE
jgi:hypothetical protein